MVAALAEVEVTLYPQQFDFVEDASRWVALVAGRNAGKTYAGSWKAMHKAQEGGLGIIAAPDFPMLEFGAKRAFLDRLRETRRPFHLDGRGVVSIPSWGAEIRFATLENEGRVRGPNYAWGWVDELEYVTDQVVWKALKGAVRDGESPQLFVTSTPKGKRLIHHEWVIDKTDRHALYRASTYDNPYIDAIDYVAGLGYEGRFFRQEIEAAFEGAEGLVYPGFDREVHLAVRDCDDWEGTIGVDAGVKNPSAIITVRHVGDARHLSREVYRRGMGGDELKATVMAEADLLGSHLDTIEVDPSAAALILDLALAGYPVRKANNSVTDGIRAVTTAFAAGMTVDPALINTIAELESYQYPDNARIETDKPVKQNDHAADAIRYALMGISAPVSEVFIE